MFFPRINGHIAEMQIGKVVCVGRNYAAHAKELNNPIPSQPILFMKPASALVDMALPLRIPQQQGSVHHELEIAILINESLHNASEEDCRAAIAGVGLGLDLTLRDVQDQLKQKGHPWERAKAFDGACPLSAMVSADQITDWHNLPLKLLRNGELQQDGNSRDMLFPVLPLLSHISSVFTLEPGDLVLTGTPAGVGPLYRGDRLEASLAELIQVSTEVE